MKRRTPDLTIAAVLLVAEVAVAVALSFVLGQLSLPADWIILAVWGFNLLPAWFLSKVARQHDRSQLGYGLLAALGPPGGVAAYVFLHGIDFAARLDRPGR